MSKPFKAKEFDPKAYIERYHRSSKGLPIPGLDNIFFTQKREETIRTNLVPATWTHVLVISFVWAVCINIVKLGIYTTFGKPNLIPASASEEDIARPAP